MTRRPHRGGHDGALFVDRDYVPSLAELDIFKQEQMIQSIKPITPQKASLLGVVLCPFFAFGAETTLEIEQATPDRQKAVQTAIQLLSQDLMEKFMEPAKLKAQKKRIQKIISTYSNRYILYTKTSAPIQKGPKFILPVRIGFSEENLKKILLKEELFYSGSSHLRILPLISYKNRVTKADYGWWRKNNRSPKLSQVMSAFYSHIQTAFLPYHFFVIHPEQAGSRYFVPKSLLSRRLDQKKRFQLARFFQSHLIMTGLVTVKESDTDSFLNLKVQLSVYNTDSGRLLAEVERFEKIPISAGTNKLDPEHLDPVAVFLKRDTSFAKSLSAQLQLIYEEGQLSSHLAQIQIDSTLRHLDLERFKQLLIKNIKAITSLKAYIISQRSLTYMANTTKGLEELSQEIKSAHFKGFDVRVSGPRKNKLILKVSGQE